MLTLSEISKAHRGFLIRQLLPALLYLPTSLWVVCATMPRAGCAIRSKMRGRSGMFEMNIRIICRRKALRFSALR